MNTEANVIKYIKRQLYYDQVRFINACKAIWITWYANKYDALHNSEIFKITIISIDSFELFNALLLEDQKNLSL